MRHKINRDGDSPSLWGNSECGSESQWNKTACRHMLPSFSKMETMICGQRRMKKNTHSHSAEQIKLSYSKQTGCNYTPEEETIYLILVFFFLPFFGRYCSVS